MTHKEETPCILYKKVFDREKIFSQAKLQHEDDQHKKKHGMCQYFLVKMAWKRSTKSSLPFEKT